MVDYAKQLHSDIVPSSGHQRAAPFFRSNLLQQINHAFLCDAEGVSPMPNTCTICRHKERTEIESALARGDSLRDIAGQFQSSKSSVDRHQRCVAAELQALKASRSLQRGETILQRLVRYRLVAEKHLNDDEKALQALDRCYKQIEIEAKLTGAYQKKQENQPDAQRRHEVVVEAYKRVFALKTYDEAVAAIKAIYEAPDTEAVESAIRAAIDEDAQAIESVWLEAERTVIQRESTMIH